MVKQCTKCNNIKSTSDFHKRLASPDGLSYNCKLCKKSMGVNNYINNKNKIKESARLWKLNNPDKVKLNRQREKLSIRYKQCRQEYRQSHKEEIKFMKKLWIDRNRDRVAISKHNAKIVRRSREDSGWSITASWWEDLLAIYDSKCVYCGTEAALANKSKKKDGTVAYGLTPDHIMPLAKGGLHVAGNILPACMICQRAKSSKPLGEWLPSIGVFI